MATQDTWNKYGLMWLDTLEEMAAEEDETDSTTFLTQFERNLTEMLRRLVVKPEDETPPPEPDALTKRRVNKFRQRAADFYVDELDENEWSVDPNPMVSLAEDGAYVQFWRWFPNEDDDDE